MSKGQSQGHVVIKCTAGVGMQVDMSLDFYFFPCTLSFQKVAGVKRKQCGFTSSKQQSVTDSLQCQIYKC